MVGGSIVSRLMVGGLAVILDVHHVARVSILGLVGDNLSAAIGEENVVRAIGGVAITGLLSTKLHIALVVVLGVDTICILVFWGSILVDGLMV